MSEHKRKIILATVIASILIVVLAEASVSFFPSQSQLPASKPSPELTQSTTSAPPIPEPAQTISTNPSSTEPTSTPFLPGGPVSANGTIITEIPISSTLELSLSKGFTYSTVASGSTSQSMLVLPLGTTGSLPFEVISTEGINESLSVSCILTLQSGLSRGQYNFGVSYSGTSFDVSPVNFVLPPGGKVNLVLTVSSGENIPTTFYSPFITLETNSSFATGTDVAIPPLLVSNLDPACLFLVSSMEPNPYVTSSGSTFSPQQVEPSTPDLSVSPTLNLTSERSAVVMYSYLTQDNLTINYVPPTGFTAQTSPNQINITFSPRQVSGELTTITLSAVSDVLPGTYKVDVTGFLNSQQFTGSFYIVFS